MAQATKKKAPLVPKLRFPDFADDREWKNEKFSTLFIFETTNSLSRENLNYLSGTVKNIHYGDIHTKFSAHFDISKEKVPYINEDTLLEKIKKSNYCAVGDLIFADASEDLKDIGKCIEIINLNNENLLSGLHTLLARPNSDTFIIRFCGHLFQSACIRTQIQNEAQGTKILGLSAGRLSKIQVCYPQRKKGQRISEQQKIADCLTSLDANITAEGQKLETLTTHKKALMQKLFPAEGEKVPVLRFKDFAGAREWEEKKLGDISDICTGKKDANEGSSNGIYPFFTCAENNIYCNSYSFDTEALLIAGNANVGLTKYYNGKFEAYQRTYVLYNFININIQYLYCFLCAILQNSLMKQIQTSAMSYIKLCMLTEFNINIPFSADEQQRIANCLTSLDEYITAQGQKVALLKEHKKGLMQQLFPRMEEENV